MDRFRSGRLTGLVTFFMAIALCVPNSGCVSALATGMWLLNGNNVKAEFKDLKGKRVAVVCRPPASLGFSHANTAPDLAKQIGILLKKNVSKIEVVSQQDVANWNDENTWDDFAEIGQALKADVVVGVDLEDFTLYQGQTLYQGKANVRIRVYDLKNSGSVVFDKIPPRSVYPPNTGIPTSEKQESEFRRQYIAILAEEIAQHFYDYDPNTGFARDSTSLD
jgi:hypothetical protein